MKLPISDTKNRDVTASELQPSRSRLTERQLRRNEEGHRACFPLQVADKRSLSQWTVTAYGVHSDRTSSLDIFPKDPCAATDVSQSERMRT